MDLTIDVKGIDSITRTRNGDMLRVELIGVDHDDFCEVDFLKAIIDNFEAYDVLDLLDNEDIKNYLSEQ